MSKVVEVMKRTVSELVVVIHSGNPQKGKSKRGNQLPQIIFDPIVQQVSLPDLYVCGDYVVCAKMHLTLHRLGLVDDACCNVIAQKVFIPLLCKSQFPHKSVNSSFIITDIKNTLRDLCGS